MSTEIAEWIAIGWREVRPSDELIIKAMADGGEGTLRAIEAVREDVTRITQSVVGPDNRSHNAFWLLADDGTAFVELANASGLTLLSQLRPLEAHTFGLGQILYNISRDDEIERVIIALGGSASTDGGTGALRALGLHFLDEGGRELDLGGGSLHSLSRIETAAAHEPPPGGVICLLDVDTPMLGERGSAALFAPQKGADSKDVALLEEGLTRFQEVVGEQDSPGAGAAGGTAYGLKALWGARFTKGARAVAQMIGLTPEIDRVDLIITGEGRVDTQSFDGKVVGSLFELVAESTRPNLPIAVIAGGCQLNSAQVAFMKERGLLDLISLVDFATDGSDEAKVESAKKSVKEFTIAAGRELAKRFSTEANRISV